MPEMRGNIGEWSELYTFLRLLSKGRVYAADDNARRLDDMYYPIKKIIREETHGMPIEYVTDGNTIDIDSEGHRIMTVDGAEMENIADSLRDTLLEYAHNNYSGAFELDDVREYANGIRVTRLKAPSNVTTDILMVLHDIHTDMDRETGFSIKSEIGGAPTLINASGATNFKFEVTGLSDDNAEEINGIEGGRKIINRMNAIRNYGGNLIFTDTVNENFARNLRMEDGDMARIVAEALKIYFEDNLSDCKDVIEKLGEADPLGYGETLMYEAKFKRFLCDSALGMMPSKRWNGENESSGGYIIVKSDGDVLAYTLYDMDAFKNYLYNWTKFERGSTTRHNFMELYSEGDRRFVNLNLQIRFKKSPVN